MKKTNRRDFIRKSATAVTAVGLTPYLLSSAQPAKAESANDRLLIGGIGVGGMGQGDLCDFTGLGDVVAVCDVDANHVLAAQNHNDIGKKVDGQKIGKPDGYKDYRKVLDRKDIDIISISTTDPWHVKIAIEELQAGKHVFCQKPLTLTIEEGKLIRNACKKYKDQVFVVGTQQRAQKNQFATACLMVRKGMLGDIKKMTADIGGSPTGGPFPKQAAPENLDFNMWLGQCPEVEYIPERVHGNFRWWYEYGAGKFTDWGAHHIDFCHWALGEVEEGSGPISFNPIIAKHWVPLKDGYPTVDDCYNTSQEFQISCMFPSGVEMVVCSNSRDGNGILIEGTKGRMHVDRGRIKGKPIEDGLHKQLTDNDYRELYNGKEYDEWHKRNFIACIKEGGLPVSDVYSHVQAMNSCHLCAISARLGREIKWNPKTEQIVGDDQAASFIARERRKGFEIPVV